MVEVKFDFDIEAFVEVKNVLIVMSSCSFVIDKNRYNIVIYQDNLFNYFY